MIPKYKTLTRTTLHDMGALPHVGIYIMAYMGRVVYVGKAEESINYRLHGHLYKRDVEDIGAWMYKVRDDWHNVRLDVLECPDNVDSRRWLVAAESALIHQLCPLMNTALVA